MQHALPTYLHSQSLHILLLAQRGHHGYDLLAVACSSISSNPCFRACFARASNSMCKRACIRSTSSSQHTCSQQRCRSRGRAASRYGSTKAETLTPNRMTVCESLDCQAIHNEPQRWREQHTKHTTVLG